MICGRKGGNMKVAAVFMIIFGVIIGITLNILPGLVLLIPGIILLVKKKRISTLRIVSNIVLIISMAFIGLALKILWATANRLKQVFTTPIQVLLFLLLD